MWKILILFTQKIKFECTDKKYLPDHHSVKGGEPSVVRVGGSVGEGVDGEHGE